MKGWTVCRGAKKLGLAVSYARRLTFNVNSEGVSLLVGDGPDNATLIYSGSGPARVRASVEGATMFVVPYEKDGLTVLDVPEVRQADIGWTDEPSLTDLEPKPFGVISPEIRAVMDQMNRNAIIREQALLRSLGRR